MSGESQRWMYDEILSPAANTFVRANKRFDAGELSPPLSGHWTLAGPPDDDIHRAKQFDLALERRLRGVVFPEEVEASLHALVNTFADDLTG